MLRHAVSITAPDGLDHLVGDTVLATSPDGRYRARCGAVVISAGLDARPGRPCVLCAGDQPERRRRSTR